MTPEEAKNMKDGDAVDIRATIESIAKGDNATVCIKITPEPNHSIYYCVPIEFLHVATPAPKHDPRRKFKTGDKVRVVEWNGRDIARVGMEGRVVGDECNSKVELTIDGWTKDVFYPACHLELVTPVEETEPYSIIVQPEDYHCVRIMKGTKIHSSIPFDEEECVCRTLEEAKAAAEEERDRLNAEYRKEQK